jgi:hypothetical protein
MHRSTTMRVNKYLMMRSLIVEPKKIRFIYTTSSSIAAKASVIESQDASTTKLERNYGLHIHHSKHVGNDDESYIEPNDQMLEDAIQSIANIHSTLNDSELSSKKQIEALNTLIKDLQSDVNTMKQSLQRLYNFLEKKVSPEDHPIEAFHFEFRGLFLTIRYTLDHALQALKSNGYSESTLDETINRMKVLKTLAHMGTILIQERESVLNNCCTKDNCSECRVKCHRVVYYPFSDNLNIYDYKQLMDMDVEKYFSEIGTQFDPMLRIFLSLMVTVTASHGNSLNYNPLFRTGIFYASNLYYLLNSSEAAKVATKFMSNLTTDAGKGLWTMQDTNPLVKMFTYLGLPHIEISSTFQIPFNKPDHIHDDSRKKVLHEEETVADEVSDKEPVLQGYELERTIGESTVEELKFHTDHIPRILSNSKNLPDNIQIRIISSKKLSVPPSQVELQQDYPYLGTAMHSLYSYGKLIFGSNEQTDSNGLIFHIHGGGFIALSSFTHEVCSIIALSSFKN